MSSYFRYFRAAGYQPVARFPMNVAGRDFVMGDLHGEIGLLRDRLAEVGFDTTKDRLFSVGDLIDRGPNSLACLRLLREPWFFCVMGNHEQMMIDYLVGGESDFWLKNGGDWHLKLDSTELAELHALILLVQALPCIIVVGDGERRFHVVHAVLPSRDEGPIPAEEWEDIHLECVLWSRRCAKYYRDWLGSTRLAEAKYSPLLLDELIGQEAYRPIHPPVPLTFCGHTTVNRPGLWWSHYFLDTGCGYVADGKLTLLQVDSPIEQYQYFIRHPIY